MTVSASIYTSSAHLAPQPAVQVADAALVRWRSINSCLSPIIGKRGVVALYTYSLHLGRNDYPWLADVHQATVQAGEFAQLHAALARQPCAEAEAASQSLQTIFQNLLVRLIGAALTDRLLPPSAPCTGTTCQTSHPDCAP